MGVTVSSSHIVSAAPSSSGGGLLTLPLLQREVPLMDISPQNSPTEVLPTGCSSSQTAPVWVPSTGCSPSGTGCSIVSPPRGHKSCQQRCSGVSSTLHRSWQDPAPAWDPYGVTASFRHPPALAWDPFHGLLVYNCSTVDLHGLQGGNCLTVVFITGCRGKLSAPLSGPPSPPPSSLTLVSAESFLSRSPTLLS